MVMSITVLPQPRHALTTGAQSALTLLQCDSGAYETVIRSKAKVRQPEVSIGHPQELEVVTPPSSFILLMSSCKTPVHDHLSRD